jgi:hypothetical protein
LIATITAKVPNSVRLPGIKVRFPNSKYFDRYYNAFPFETDGSSKFFITVWAGISICFSFYCQYYSVTNLGVNNKDGGTSSSLSEIL